MNFGDIVNEAEQLIEQHPDQAKAAFDQASSFANEQTGNQYSGVISKGEEMLESRLGIQDEAPQGQ